MYLRLALKKKLHKGCSWLKLLGRDIHLYGPKIECLILSWLELGNNCTYIGACMQCFRYCYIWMNDNLCRLPCTQISCLADPCLSFLPVITLKHTVTGIHKEEIEKNRHIYENYLEKYFSAFFMTGHLKCTLWIRKKGNISQFWHFFMC